MTAIAMAERRLDDTCRRYGITRLEVFGSVARGEAGADSDIDLLYEIAPGHSLGWEIEDLTEELEAHFGRRVDLISRASLHPLIREEVLSEARDLYEQA